MFDLFRSQVRQGDEVVLFLISGREARGKVDEISDHYIFISNDSGPVVVSDQFLGGWEVVSTRGDGARPSPAAGRAPGALPPSQTGTPSPPAEVKDFRAHENGEGNSGAGTVPEPLPPSNALLESTARPPQQVPDRAALKLAEIDASYRVAIQLMHLKPLPPRIQFPNEEYSQGPGQDIARGEWNKILNAYQYALKIAELNRLNGLVNNLRRMHDWNPKVKAVMYNLGCFLGILGRHREALPYFERAGKGADGLPEAMLNAAWAALELNRRATACWWLSRYRLADSVRERDPPWFVLVRLVANLGAYDLWQDLLRVARESDGRGALLPVVLEAVAFHLKSAGRDQAALVLCAAGDEASADTQAVSEALRALTATPDPEWVRLREEQQNERLRVPDNRQMPPTSAPDGELVPERPKVKTFPLEKWRKASQGGLPRGNDPYARAKRAQLDEKNLPRAEKLYREAIASGYNAENAIKDLAMLLQQTGRNQEATDLIERHLADGSFPNPLPAFNLLATLYQHVGKHDKALEHLRKVYERETPQRKLSTERRIAVSEYMRRDYKAAEKTLLHILASTPGDRTARRWLDALLRARESGEYTEADEVFQVQPGFLAELSSGLSPTLRFALDRCEFIGLRKEDITSRNFSEDTVNRLEGYIGRQGKARPREVAQSCLTAARVLEEIRSENHTRFRRFLRTYGAKMGDSAALENRPMDVVRSYYGEAFAVEQEWSPELTMTAAQFILSYLNSRNELLAERLPGLGEAIKRVFLTGVAPVDFWDGFLEVCVINLKAAETILPLIYRHEPARTDAVVFLRKLIEVKGDPLLNRDDFMACWELARNIRKRQQDQWFQIIQAVSIARLSAAETSNLQKIIAECSQNWLCGLDRRRMDELGQIVTALQQFNEQASFEEKERNYQLAKTLIPALKTNIEENPTRYAIGGLYPLLEPLYRTTEDSYEELLRRSEPRVSLSLAVDEASPNKDGVVQLRVALANADGCAPITNSQLTIIPQPDLFCPRQDKYLVPGSVRGNESTIVPCEIALTPEAIASPTISIEVALSFVNRRNETKDLGRMALGLKLYSRSEFRPIPNPFAPFAKGGPVTDQKMFVGREDVLRNIQEAIENSVAKCYVVYGQKRSGKSSVLHHLSLRLNESGRFLCVSFSIGDILVGISVRDFLYQILRKVRNALDELSESGRDVPPFHCPTLHELAEAPAILFSESLDQFRKDCRSLPHWENTKIILLIDEFTYIYTCIVKNEVPASFMKTWKALLEQQLFSAVLVGQDVMPKFKDRFPNEFGVTKDERLTYLSPLNSRKLIEDPIRIGGPEGVSRFRGQAMARVIEVTAGNPFYVQILGDRLVQQMNSTHSLYATEVEVNEVVRELVSGTNPLSLDDFDGLLTAGDADEGGTPKAETLAVLRAIANGSQSGSCSRSTIALPQADAILAELLRRDVIEQPQPTYYRIRVGLFREWLVAHP